MEEMTFIPIPLMEGFPFGLTFFGERNPVYVSPKVYKDIQDKLVPNLQYAMLAYRRDQRTIEEAVQDIIDEVKDGLKGKYEMGVLDNTSKSD